MPAIPTGARVHFRYRSMGIWLQDGRYIGKDANGRHVVEVRGQHKVAASVKLARDIPAEDVPVPVRAPAQEPIVVTTRLERDLEALGAYEPRSFAKPPKPVQDNDYKAFVRVKDCCCCFAPGPSDPHHYGPRGVGQKTDDLRCVPLCRTCHDHFHHTNTLPGYTARNATETFILRTQVNLIIEWARRFYR